MIRIFVAISLIFSSCLKAEEIRETHNEAYRIWLNCDKNVAVMSDVLVDKFGGGESYKSGWLLDKELGSCQQRTTTKYYDIDSEKELESGFLVNPYFLSEKNGKEAYRSSNRVPMAINLRRGAWDYTDALIGCIGREKPVRVMSGAIWSNEKADDRLLVSHGILIPDYYWRVVQVKEGVMAWLFPNTDNATRGRVDKYLISISDLEKRTGVEIPIEAKFKGSVEIKSWPLNRGCKASLIE